MSSARVHVPDFAIGVDDDGALHARIEDVVDPELPGKHVDDVDQRGALDVEHHSAAALRAAALAAASG